MTDNFEFKDTFFQEPYEKKTNKKFQKIHKKKHRKHQTFEKELKIPIKIYKKSKTHSIYMNYGRISEDSLNRIRNEIKIYNDSHIDLFEHEKDININIKLDRMVEELNEEKKPIEKESKPNTCLSRMNLFLQILASSVAIAVTGFGLTFANVFQR